MIFTSTYIRSKNATENRIHIQWKHGTDEKKVNICEIGILYEFIYFNIVELILW